jgi:hypothetical protein
MTPVHPVETSDLSRRSRDRQQPAWRRAAAFQLPDSPAPADDLPLPATPPAFSPLLIAAESGQDATESGQASHAFVENVTRVMRTPHSIAGLFVDVTV